MVALFPGVYLASPRNATFAHRVEGAWLWSRRQGVVAGLAASRLYGAKWVDDTEPVELAWTNARPPDGILTSALHLAAGEIVVLGRIPVTSLARTAFDLARRPPQSDAVARVDALGAAADFDCQDVLGMAARHRGARGVRQIPASAGPVRRRRAIAKGDLAAAARHRCGFSQTADSDPGARREHDVLPRHGVGGPEGCGRIRRRPPPNRPHPIRQGHQAPRGTRRPRVDRRQGRGRHSAPGHCRQAAARLELRSTLR